MAVVRGADVSAYQQVVYATAAKSIGFLIVKCTEGAHTTSSAWRTHWTGARGAGLLRGSYHLCHPSQSSAVAEADHYVAVLKSSGFTSGLDLPPVLDIEPGHSLGKAALTTWARTFLGRVDAGLGLTSPWLRSGVYVGDSIASSVDVAAIVTGRWFWRGGYGNTWPTSVPAGCSIFQRVMPVTAVPGVKGSAVDVDVARPEDLARMAPAYYATQNPVEEDMPLTDADAAKIAKAVWLYQHAPGATTRAIGGYPDGWSSAAINFVAAADAKHNRLWKLLTAVLPDIQAGVAALAKPMSDTEREALSASIAAKVDTLRISIQHDDAPAGDIS